MELSNSLGVAHSGPDCEAWCNMPLIPALERQSVSSWASLVYIVSTRTTRAMQKVLAHSSITLL